VLTTACNLALVPTQPPTQWILRALSLGIKRSGCEADHSIRLLPRLRIRGAIPPLPIVFIAWYLIEHRMLLHGVVLC
jgi:hypothetical protein